MARTQIDKSLIPSIGSLSKYRRPNLLYVDAFRVQPESGLIDGNSSNTHILFPDGELRVDSTASHVLFEITRNAVINGTNQSGLRTGLSEATNTWYAIYAVKEQNASGWVMVGDTVLPLKTNYSTINTNFGTNGWVYLGMIRNGDNASATGDILNFEQCGNTTIFKNTCTSANSATGLTLATTTGTSLNYSYSAGTGSTQVPNHILIVDVHLATNGYASADQRVFLGANGGTPTYGGGTSVASASFNCRINSLPISLGFTTGTAASTTIWIHLCGFRDTVLGVGTNPLF